MWRYVLADRTGASLGELRAFERSLSVGVSKTATATCRIRIGDPLWDDAADVEPLLRVYNSAGALVFFGEIVGAEETGQDGAHTVKLTAADLSWRLARRYIGKDTTGIGTTYTAQDSGQIVFSILAAINAEAATGITAGTGGAYLTRTITYLWKRVLDAVSELGAIQGSYEWALRYVEAAPAPTVYLDLLPALGSTRSDLFFEYGTGKSNCSSYKRTRTKEQLANRVWVLGAGSTVAPNAYDTGSEVSWGRMEDVISYGDIANVGLLDALAAAHVAIRAQPRTIVTLTPFAKLAPKYATDWAVGDLVSTRVVSRRSTRVSGLARIWSAEIAVDELGNETPTLNLEPQT